MLYVAPQWRLMWWRFRKHRVAVAAGLFIAAFYFVVIFADFFAYSDPYASDAQRGLLPPQTIHWFDQQGRFGLFVYGISGSRDPRPFRRSTSRTRVGMFYLQFFARGREYKLLWFLPTDVHLLGLEGAPTEDNLFLLGADVQGRDVWSRLVYASQTSLIIGLAGVTLSLVFGIVLGGIAGYYGGIPDRDPTNNRDPSVAAPILLWDGLGGCHAPRLECDAGVFRHHDHPVAYCLDDACPRRSRKFLSLKHGDFVTAAELAGAGPTRIIFVHLLPLFTSHIIAATALRLPSMIVAETSL